MSFEDLPHTADIRIRVRAPSMDDLFKDAADALMEVMYGKDRAGLDTTEVALESPDAESLLTDFLSELLFITDSKGVVIARADVSIDRFRLRAVLYTEPFDPARHSGGTEVKGISYTGMTVQQGSRGYSVEIVFDV